MRARIDELVDDQKAVAAIALDLIARGLLTKTAD